MDHVQYLSLPTRKDEHYFYHRSKAIHAYHQIYDKLLLNRYFHVNAKDTKSYVSKVLFQYDTINLMNDKTSSKSKNNTSCIDLSITNSSDSFQNTSTITTGLSDFQKVVVTVLKTTFLKSKLRGIPIEITGHLTMINLNQFEKFFKSQKCFIIFGV